MLKIRLATRDDAPQLLALIRQLAAYERKANQVVTTIADLLRDGFGPQPKFRAWLADWDGSAAGYASTFYFYSTYQGRPAIFIEDLFVLDRFRNRGIGKSLLSAIAKLAINEGCFGLRWEVLDWNKPAIEWYEKLGATFLNERKVVALDAEVMRRLAEASGP